MKRARIWLRFWRVAGSVSIRTKIMGIVASLVLGFGMFMVWYIPHSEAQYLTEQLEERGLTIARSVAAVGQDMALTNNQFGLYMLAKNTLSSNKDVAYVFITSSQGEPLVHTFQGGFPVDLLELGHSSLFENPRVTPLLTERGKIRDIALPILGSRAGVVHVGLDETSLLAYSEEHSRHILTITAIALLLGILFAYWLATILTRPISNLETATKLVADSNFDWQAPIWARDEIGRLGMSFNEMTRKVAERTQEIVEKNRELTTLNALSQSLNRSLNLQDKLSSALKTMSALLELKSSCVFLLNHQTQKLDLFCQDGVSVPITPPMAEELATNLKKDRPFIIEKLKSETLPLTGPLLSENGLVPLALVPLKAEQRFLGFLALAKNSPPGFVQNEMHLLAAIGEQLGVAVENSILWQELKQKETLRTQLLAKVISAQEDERKRIARELHDQTSQSITSLMVGLRVAEEANDGNLTRRRIGELRALAANTLEEVRALSLALRPSVLDDLGLIPALNRYVKDCAPKNGLSIQFQTLGFTNQRLRPEIETAIYRVVQEALTNVVRHAEARKVSVILELSASKLRAITEDDGKGFDVDKVMSSPSLDMRLGLFGMEERISLIGGKLTIESAPGKGTTVYVEVPLDENK